MESEQGIRRVSWIPKRLDVEVENLRKKIGYTRSGFYRYALTRLLEQTLLSKPTETHLDLWQEITGILEIAETKDQLTTITISCTKDHKITLPINTQQATLQQLRKSLGQRIALIRTDLQNKPLIIRTLYDTRETRNTSFWALWCRKRGLFVLRFVHFFEGGC